MTSDHEGDLGLAVPQETESVPKFILPVRWQTIGDLPMRDWRGHIPTIGELGPLRRHQGEIYYRTIDIVERQTTDKVTVLSVTPGGGKSLAAAIYGHVLLLSGYIDRLIIVVPRHSLREQMKEDFHQPKRGLFLRVASVTPEVSQRALFPVAGYVTTYQSLAHGAGARYVKATKNLRVGVILDEIHHLTDVKLSGWVPGARALVERENCVAILAMSGGLGRHDEKKIPFIPYDESNAPIKHISYSRREALQEHAIVPLRIDLRNSETEYHHKGQDHAVTLAKANKKQEKPARRTALLLEEYWVPLLKTAVETWINYAQNHGGYMSQLIVISDQQTDARRAYRWLRENYAKYEVALAISDEGRSAINALKRFRTRTGENILVTCKMAYEGLDAPFATHMVYLSRVRSAPFMDQAFARITRFNKECGLPWEQQAAIVFAPQDPSMKAYVDQLDKDQDERYRDQAKRLMEGRGFARRGDFVPQRADPTDTIVGGEHGIAPPTIQAAMRKLREDYPTLQNVSAVDLERLARAFVNAREASP